MAVIEIDVSDTVDWIRSPYTTTCSIWRPELDSSYDQAGMKISNPIDNKDKLRKLDNISPPKISSRANYQIYVLQLDLFRWSLTINLCANCMVNK